MQPAEILKCLGFTKKEIAFLTDSMPPRESLPFSNLMNLWQRRSHLPESQQKKVELALALQIDQVQPKDLIHIKTAAKTTELRQACHTAILTNLGAVWHLGACHVLTDPDYLEPVLALAIEATAKRLANKEPNLGAFLVLDLALRKIESLTCDFANTACARARELVEPALRTLLEHRDYADLQAVLEDKNEIESTILTAILIEITWKKILEADPNNATLLRLFQNARLPEALSSKMLTLLQPKLNELTDEQLISLYADRDLFAYKFLRQLRTLLNHKLRRLTSTSLFSIVLHTPPEHPLHRKAKTLYLKRLMTQYPLSRTDNFIGLDKIVTDDQELFDLYSRTYDELCAGYKPDEIADQLTYVAQQSDKFRAWLMTKAFT